MRPSTTEAAWANGRTDGCYAGSHSLSLSLLRLSSLAQDLPGACTPRAQHQALLTKTASTSTDNNNNNEYHMPSSTQATLLSTRTPKVSWLPSKPIDLYHLPRVPQDFPTRFKRIHEFTHSLVHSTYGHCSEGPHMHACDDNGPQITEKQNAKVSLFEAPRLAGHAWPTWRKLLRSRFFMTRRRTHCAALHCAALHCTRRSRSPLAALPPPLEIGAGSKIWYELLGCDLRAVKKTAHK